MRIEKPWTLIEALLAADPEWTPERVDATLGYENITIRTCLSEQVAVFILYWTAFFADNGRIHLRSDPYNWDRLLLQLIGLSG